MITIQGVSADSHYFEKDELMKDAGKSEYYSQDKSVQSGYWTYNADILKDRTGIDIDQLGVKNMFEKLVEAGVGSKEMVGQDLTFSANKDVSLLWSLGDNKLKDIAYQAHHEAVEKVLKHIDENLIKTRETHNGETVHVQGKGMTAVAFDHGTSREKDPQLHTHVVILNQIERETDGEVRAIDFKATLKGAERKQLDILYKSEMARYLVEHGIRIEWDKDGRDFKVVGIEDKQRQAFSRREQEILKYAEEKNLNMSNQHDRQKAILETREAKGKVSFEELKQEWQERANRLGLDINKLVEENKLSQEEIEKKIQELELKAESDVARQVQGEMNGVFTKTEFLAQAAQIAHQLNREFDLEQSEKELKKLMERGEVLSLGKVSGQEMFVTKEFIEAEKYIADSVNKTLEDGKGFVSEQQFEKDMQEFREVFKQQNGFWLSNEQEQALKMIFTSDRFINGIQGYAGVGKSALFKAANEYGQWLGEKYGADKAVHFIGMAPTGQAAKVLQESSGITSNTIHSTLNQLEKKGRIEIEERKQETAKQNGQSESSPKQIAGQEIKEIANELKETGKLAVKEAAKNALDNWKWNAIKDTGFAKTYTKLNEWKRQAERIQKGYDRLEQIEKQKQTQEQGIKKEWDFSDVQKTEGRTVIIMDEAGMADSRLMEQAIKAADTLGVKLVLSGDVNQFQSVGAGKAFDMMQRKGMKTAYITGIRRQKDEQVREALKSFANGDVKKLQNLLEQRGWIHERESSDKVIEGVQEKYKELLEKANGDPSKVMVLAQTNKMVDTLNENIRKYLKEQGKIDENGTQINVVKDRSNTYKGKDVKDGKVVGEKTVTIGEKRETTKEFASGDRIVFLKNDKQIDVQNGLQGTIEKINPEEKTITVKTDNEQKVTFNYEKYNQFDYSYAITEHKSQGATVEHAVVVHEGNATKNAVYVAMTRAKDETHIFTTDKKDFYEDMTIKQENRSALELLEIKEREERILNAERIEIEKVEKELSKNHRLTREEKEEIKQAWKEAWARVNEKLSGTLTKEEFDKQWNSDRSTIEEKNKAYHAYYYEALPEGRVESVINDREFYTSEKAFAYGGGRYETQHIQNTLIMNHMHQSWENFKLEAAIYQRTLDLHRDGDEIVNTGISKDTLKNMSFEELKSLYNEITSDKYDGRFNGKETLAKLEISDRLREKYLQRQEQKQEMSKSTDIEANKTQKDRQQEQANKEEKQTQVQQDKQEDKHESKFESRIEKLESSKEKLRDEKIDYSRSETRETEKSAEMETAREDKEISR